MQRVEEMMTDNVLNKTSITGNAGLSSNKEIFTVAALKKNLEWVNSNSGPVTPSNGIYVRYVKRVLDFCITLPIFTVLLPINCILAICTYFDVGRPIIFRQTRIGKDGQLFQIIKFRNMTNDTDENGNLLPPSQRVTRFGRFVRKYSIDELMNFWSVLKGDMSLIGPRPLPVIFEERYSERHRMRCAVRPGLECPYMIGHEEWPTYQRKFENDIWYVENVSFVTDCKMVWGLVKMVLNFKRRSKNAAASGYFIGYDDDGFATTIKQLEKKTMRYAEEYEMQCREESVTI
jgi:undecaprenyl phosphate N,N'-diacetylbacillosamine 1-phosphate transferase